MRKLFPILLFSAVLVVAASCTKDNVADEPGPTSLDLKSADVVLDYTTGSSEKVYFQSSHPFLEVTVTPLENSGAWLTATLITGDSVLLKTTSENTTYGVRSATVTLVAGYGSNTIKKDITVSQTPAPATLTLSKETLSIENLVGLFEEVTATSNQASVSATVPAADAGWCSAIVTGKVIRVTVTALNPSSSPRSTTVTVSAGLAPNVITKNITVTQAEMGAPLLLLSSATANLAKEANSYAEITATTNQTDLSAVVAAGGAAWCTAVFTGSTLKITATSENTDPTPRTTTVTVTGSSAGGTTVSKDVTVSQAGQGYRVGDFASGGIIFWISEDQASYKVISLAEATANDARWCTARTPLVGADNLDDGAYNVAKMKAVDATLAMFPAAKFCNDMGAGWYMPAKNEFTQIYNAAITAADPTGGTFNGYITEKGGTGLNYTTYYFTSSEVSETNATLCRFNAWGFTSLVKDGATRLARCVKKVDM